MDGKGNVVKNVVFRQVKSGQIIINSAEDFCEAGNQLCRWVTMLFQKSDVILSEPSDFEKAPIIKGTLKIHKFTPCLPRATGETQINFSFLSNSKELCCTQRYTTKKRCSHVDQDFNSFAQFRTLCASCVEKHTDADGMVSLSVLWTVIVLTNQSVARSNFADLRYRFTLR